MSGFLDFEKQYGLPAQADRLSEDEAKALRGKLPDNLIEYLISRGVGQYDDGLFRTVKPSVARSLIEPWGEERAQDSTFLITAFGCFAYRDGNENHFVNVYASTDTLLFDDPADVFDGNLCRPQFVRDILLKKDFRSARSRLGAPGDDECFGFFPPLAMGGDGSSASIQKVKMREHLALLSQLAP